MITDSHALSFTRIAEHHWKLDGELTERADFSLLQSVVRSPVTFDLRGIRYLNSAGVQRWVRFIEAIASHGPHRFVGCSQSVVTQLNLIPNFNQGATIVSVMAPFLCPKCDQESDIEIQCDSSGPVTLSAQICEQCGEELQFSDVVERYFAFKK